MAKVCACVGRAEKKLYKVCKATGQTRVLRCHRPNYNENWSRNSTESSIWQLKRFHIQYKIERWDRSKKL